MSFEYLVHDLAIIAAAFSIWIAYLSLRSVQTLSKDKTLFYMAIAAVVWNIGNSYMIVAQTSHMAQIFRLITLFGVLMFLFSMASFIGYLADLNPTVRKWFLALYGTYNLFTFFRLSQSDSVSYFKNDVGTVYTYTSTLCATMLIFSWVIVGVFSVLAFVRSMKQKSFWNNTFYSLCATAFIALVHCAALALEILWPHGSHFSLSFSGAILTLSLCLTHYGLQQFMNFNLTEQSLLKNMYQLVSVPILVFSENNTLLQLNKASETFFMREVSVGSHLNRFFRVDQLEDGIKLFDDNRHAIPANSTDGKHCELDVSIIKDHLNRPVGKIVMVYDVTERVDFISKIEDARNLAESASQAKSDFLANMSHEIRTPMNAIGGMCELILRDELSPTVRENALNIRTACNNLLGIINDVLDLSKIESGKMEIMDSPYYFHSLINDIVNIQYLRAQQKDIDFIVEIDSTFPAQLIGDELRLKQAFINIIGNAIKFTNHGFVKISIKREGTVDSPVIVANIIDSGIGIKRENLQNLFGVYNQVDTRKNRNIQGSGLGLAITKNLCEMMGGSIEVESTYGLGSTFTLRIPQISASSAPMLSIESPGEKSVLIYEPSAELASAYAYSFENLGTTYTVCKTKDELIKSLDGHTYEFFFVENRNQSDVMEFIEGQCNNLVLLHRNEDLFNSHSVITMPLPIYCLQIASVLNGEDYVSKIQDASGYVAPFILPDTRILIVDDNLVNLKVASGLMQPFEAQIDTAASGKEAIAMIENTYYDLIFMDHMMPDMDGVDATHIIRDKEGDYYKNLPIIALTANAVSGAKEMFLREGLDDFLAKPIEVLQLHKILKTWLPDKVENAIILTSPGFPTAIDYPPILQDIAFISGIDVELGLSRIAGMTDVYESTMSILSKTLPTSIQIMRDMLEAKNLKAYAVEVHGLKGSFANIGAMSLCDEAKLLEEAAKLNHLEYCQSNTHDFLDKVGQLADALQGIFLKHTAPTDSDKPRSGLEQIIIFIPEIKEALLDFDVDRASVLLDSLLVYSYTPNIDMVLTEIFENLRAFNYDACLALLTTLETEV